MTRNTRNHDGNRHGEPLQSDTTTMNRTHPQEDEPVSVIEAVNKHGISAFRAKGDNYEADK